MDINPEHDNKLDKLLVSRVLEAGQGHSDSACVQPMFCQMNRLTSTGSEVLWMQVARWIKFEEVLDEDANRWSKPHVPSLSLNALTTLRKEMRHVPCLLDPDITDFNSLVDKLTSAWIQSGYLDRSHEEAIRVALRKPHRHVHERKLPRPVSGSNLLAVRERGLGGSSVSLHSLESHVTDNEINTMNTIVPPLIVYQPINHQKNMKIQRKIPKNAVATNILIGELTTLRRPLMAFVRLKPARHLGWLCEVRLATQFMFVCLAPEVIEDFDVKQIGRCVGAIMTDPIFREVADLSSNRFELLAGISEFCGNLTALPPCVWDPRTRIEPPVKLPKQNFRRMTQKKLKERRESVFEQEEEEEGLKRTGRFVSDVKRKLPWYFSDFKDSLHIQCIASTIFLFLATLTPNVTFGGLLGQSTDQYMGTMECILAASICGVVFALFAGQPLNILGSTGPMLVLETIIYEFCRDNSWDFLPFRVWIGLWTTLILVLIAAFDLSALVAFITRFTEECFACLIAVIFIYEAFDKAIKINTNNPTYFGDFETTPSCPATTNLTSLGNISNDSINNNNNSMYLSMYSTAATPLISNLNDTLNETFISMVNGSEPTTTTTTTNSSSNATVLGSGASETISKCKDYIPDVFFLSFIEFLFTFVIAFTLVKARNSIFFPNVVRRMMSDFGVLIAIVIVVGVDIALDIKTPKLEVPAKFSPTRGDRSWLISPVSDKNPWYLSIAAVLPALLATILIFMDQQITAVIVNRKEHKLKKGSGYHLDILVLAVLISVMSFLGLPWYVAATVSALAHIMSLKVESDCAAPGEKPEFLGVREQRVTALLVGILSGLSILLTSVLRVIPLPVLYGVFLFMGVRALDGMQLVDRILLYVVSPKYQPDYPYLRHVQLTRVHLYTLIQVLCLAGLWIVKTVKATSIGFPIMVLATCFIRKFLDCLFSQDELIWLDHLLPSLKRSARNHGGLGKDTQEVPGFSSYTNSDLHYSHVIVPEINILRNDHDSDPMELRPRAHSDRSDDSIGCLGNNNIAKNAGNISNSNGSTKHNDSSSSINGNTNVAFVGGAGVEDETVVVVGGGGGGGGGGDGGSSSVEESARSIPQVRIVCD
ncbi:hypothetical protein EGW08_007674 [Elysia chlorotica]|uniref:Anion exchange protein n=1 Tax=Elysia chlorotica TaxID=188477 RepID=A0A433TSI9_ELYCH|nr:hypothetical protein EGW08_007674 [Elysia chlorotica]